MNECMKWIKNEIKQWIRIYHITYVHIIIKKSTVALTHVTIVSLSELFSRLVI